MNKKVFFTDLDGTLLNDQKEITPGNQAAIDEALCRGHKVVITTGRPLASARIQAERLGLTKEGCYIVTYNGGQTMIRTTRRLYMENLFPVSSSHRSLQRLTGVVCISTPTPRPKSSQKRIVRNYITMQPTH